MALVSCRRNIAPIRSSFGARFGSWLIAASSAYFLRTELRSLRMVAAGWRTYWAPAAADERNGYICHGRERQRPRAVPAADSLLAHHLRPALRPRRVARRGAWQAVHPYPAARHRLHGL